MFITFGFLSLKAIPLIDQRPQLLFHIGRDEFGCLPSMFTNPAALDAKTGFLAGDTTHRGPLIGIKSAAHSVI